MNGYGLPWRERLDAWWQRWWQCELRQQHWIKYSTGGRCIRCNRVVD
jgi:hypothetical protein